MVRDLIICKPSEKNNRVGLVEITGPFLCAMLSNLELQNVTSSCMLTHSPKALPLQALCSSQALPVINTMKHLG